MTVSFNYIPADNRVPLFYAEMDNSAANTAQEQRAFSADWHGIVRR